MINSIFKNIIDNSLKQNKLSQVYLFSSKNIKNFDEYFLYFINSVNDEKFNSLSEIKFGDLYFFIDGKNEIIDKQSILDSIKETQETSIISKNKKKILIINNIENGTQQSLNSLLKFLENPPFNTIIIMSCNFITHVIKTIKSRAFIIEIQKLLDKDEINFKPFKNFFIISNIEYDEKIISSFTSLVTSCINSCKKPFEFLKNLIEVLNYNNKKIILDFLILVFLDIYKIINDINDLSILNEYKINKKSFAEISVVDIINTLKETKQNLNNSANFNLQKSNLLLELEKYYGI
ncbi:DNA polymerase III subunit [Metamycoplasma canadense]|uniref:DNA polymerase III subunit n=1 Tax=Metamycoplasma canadense TaxID=29554 RepID=A0A077L782_9BACT|nr:DNA polymerase III subunit [Metamycoplasma canadense]BAP39661.1 DNA polymerase III subunit [Metamycoplasma canadense]